jgi:class 3 adenylate cyclase/tetratricopeptide (TPR) repeat protein
MSDKTNVFSAFEAEHRRCASAEQHMSTDAYLPYVSRLPLAWTDSDGPVAHWLDGTLLFVDVAGFTALSERLAKTGRAGAEELTDLLNGAFARLLAAAYENGGSLLSFGGDALLLFFEGADHQRRAAHAAGVMKRKPAELGALRTTVGAVRLKLSMGAHSGRYLFLVSGQDSRVVLLLGPDVTTTVRLEQRATGGQVMLGAGLATAVPEASGPLDDGAALLLRTPRPPLVGDPNPPGEPVTPAARFLSPPLRLHIAGQPTSEHRRVAVGFLQLRGMDALLASDEGAAVQAVNDVVLATQRAAAAYGTCLLASDVDADGAKIIVVAGAPLTGEHEEDRILRTCRAVLDLSSPLQLRGGVTAGPVFVGDVGPSYRRAFTVMGERVNLAARLMASASPSELRTTPAVVAASTTSFTTTPLEPLRLKGIAEPVQAVSIGAAIGQVHERRSGALVGRDPELALLAAALHRAAEGHGGVLEVVGEPGVGKTALLTALVTDSPVPALRAAAVPYETEKPFGLLRRIIRHVLGVDAEAAPLDVGRTVAEQLSTLTPPDSALLLMAADAEIEGEQLPAVVQDDLLVRRLARAVVHSLQVLVPTGALLVIEDLQWADPSSLALLKAVAEQLDEHPWLLCLSYRPGPQNTHADAATRIALAPLDESSAGDLVHALTARAPMSPHRVSALVARSGGNPLFLTELVRLSRDSLDLPESVEGVVNARLDSLPAYLRKLLRQAAVLGAHFDLDVLREIAGFVPDREEWRILDGLLRRVGSRGEFTSEMYRDVAYQSLPYRERRVIHSQAVRLLDARGSDDVELLALHAAQAHDDERTWRYAVEAARRSMARGAHEQAVSNVRRALIAHDKGGFGPATETWSVHRLLGDALLRAGRAQEATAAFRKARALCPRGPQGDPELCHREGLARIALGEHEAAKRWLRRGLAAVRGPDDEPAHLELLRALAGAMYRQGQYAAAMRTTSELIARTEGTSHRQASAHAHDLMHTILITTGDPRRAQHRTQAVEIYEELGDVTGLAKAWNNLGLDAYYECRWDDAVQLYERSRQCEEQDANDAGAAISDANIAEVLVDQGTYEEAHTRLQRALRTFQAEDFRIGVAEVLNLLGRLETRRGGLTAAAGYLREVRELLVTMGADLLLPDVLVREAELALVEDRVEDAVGLLTRVEAAEAREEIRLTAAHLRAVVDAHRGDLDAAAARLREVVGAEEGTHRYRAALARYTLSELLGRRGDPAARAQAASALDSLRSLGVHRFRDPLAGEVVVPPTRVVLDLTEDADRAAV